MEVELSFGPIEGLIIVLADVDREELVVCTDASIIRIS